MGRGNRKTRAAAAAGPSLKFGAHITDAGLPSYRWEEKGIETLLVNDADAGRYELLREASGVRIAVDDADALTALSSALATVGEVEFATTLGKLHVERTAKVCKITTHSADEGIGNSYLECSAKVADSLAKQCKRLAKSRDFGVKPPYRPTPVAVRSMSEQMFGSRRGA